jgi:hypothetical protein
MCGRAHFFKLLASEDVNCCKVALGMPVLSSLGSRDINNLHACALYHNIVCTGVNMWRTVPPELVHCAWPCVAAMQMGPRDTNSNTGSNNSTCHICKAFA